MSAKSDAKEAASRAYRRYKATESHAAIAALYALQSFARAVDLAREVHVNHEQYLAARNLARAVAREELLL